MRLEVRDEINTMDVSDQLHSLEVAGGPANIDYEAGSIDDVGDFEDGRFCNHLDPRPFMSWFVVLTDEQSPR
jgi:hypothetical protein